MDQSQITIFTTRTNKAKIHKILVSDFAKNNDE